VAHIPHLLVARPWHDGRIDVTPDQHRHLTTVLRRDPGSPVSYTDGAGVIGAGTWTGVYIERGTETSEPEPPASLTLAVAPPDSKERIRWLVEKSTELGVERISWLRTRYGQGRPPQSRKAQAWMKSALEQSRRSRVTVVDSDWMDLSDLGEFVAADQTGRPFRPEGSVTVAIGPEGGWAPTELPPTTPVVSLGVSVLRTETAAIAAAAVFGAHFSVG
jgi:16S rRNA (uracil1498-N3)-methyltransferase